MTITAANDINSLYNVNSDAVRNSLYNVSTNSEGQKNNNIFGSILDAAVSNINTTNDLLSTQENEELKWMMGISENTHDLTIAVGKAQTALNYTIALRDKLLDAYKEIMQIQI
ncbi:MAG: flagellar hook-basal body complex protein FliE [Lachnospiraceae bacterium]|nr:flagellar hook-basal body complex protein FliE [Lachnospiraceae bacterium]MDE7414999.1 flagellar hook-basal body complex protein FliE [Lachnospiraceae bacterium]